MLAGLTDTHVANRALALLGAGAINNIDDTTKPAKLAKEYLPQAVEDVLTEHTFPRTVKHETLTVSESPFEGWDYQATLPTDYIRGVKLFSEEEYEIMGSYLYTNDAEPKLLYVANNTAGAWSWASIGSHLVLAIAYRLAVLICSELTPDQNTKARAIQEAQEALLSANKQAQLERHGARKQPIGWGEDVI